MIRSQQIVAFTLLTGAMEEGRCCVGAPGSQELKWPWAHCLWGGRAWKQMAPWVDWPALSLGHAFGWSV